MKAIQLVLSAIIVFCSMTIQAHAQEQGINGLLMGAGGGALVGQAIGRNTEGTLIGTAVGGMIGYMVGNEMDKGSYDRGYASAQPATHFLPHPPSPPSIVFSFGDRHDRRPHYRPREHCREIVTLKPRRHGGYREVVEVECWEERRRGGPGHWRGRSHDHWRDHDRGRGHHRNRW